jgi:hypothetical protein
MIPPRKGKPWPWNKIEKPRPADWGLGMTVCIAASCESSKTIVAVTDHKVTMGSFAADGVALKTRQLIGDWAILFAGEDMTHIKTIIERAREILQEETDEEEWQRTYSFQVIASALSDAYDERLQKQIESKYLKNFGLTVADFRDNGKEKLTDPLPKNQIV